MGWAAAPNVRQPLGGLDLFEGFEPLLLVQGRMAPLNRKTIRLQTTKCCEADNGRFQWAVFNYTLRATPSLEKSKPRHKLSPTPKENPWLTEPKPPSGKKVGQPCHAGLSFAPPPHQKNALQVVGVKGTQGVT